MLKGDWKDITSEKWRTYHFGDGRSYTVREPSKLLVKSKPDGDSHRVVDCADRSHYVPAGWVAIEWQAEPPFEF